jgi:hypothetical protein
VLSAGKTEKWFLPFPKGMNLNPFGETDRMNSPVIIMPSIKEPARSASVSLPGFRQHEFVDLNQTPSPMKNIPVVNRIKRVWNK